MANLRGWEIIVLIAIVLLLFGSKKLPDAARGIGRSLRIFKAETKGLIDDDKDSSEPKAVEGDSAPPAVASAAAQPPTDEAAAPAAPAAIAAPPAPEATAEQPIAQAPPAAAPSPAPPAAPSAPTSN
ncbi:MAG: hypothetical protein RLZ55_838 [Actinomycetota bacterium]